VVTKVFDDLISDGFSVIENCINKKSINFIMNEMNKYLIQYLKFNNLNSSKKFSKNFYLVKKNITHYEIQVLLSKYLVDKGLIENLIFNDKLMQTLITLLGPDIEYLSDFEMAINDKFETDNDYLFKKYHQEFWSGMGIEAFQLWVPIYLLEGMGTIEVIKKSHTWGHIPHQNREPINLPKKHDSEILDIDTGSVAIFTAFTLHRTVKNKIDQPRIALPITIRNPYYPNTGNLDLFNFKKINFSFYSRFRKILGNTQYSPFRTLGQDRTDLFKK